MSSSAPPPAAALAAKEAAQKKRSKNAEIKRLKAQMKKQSREHWKNSVALNFRQQKASGIENPIHLSPYTAQYKIVEPSTVYRSNKIVDKYYALFGSGTPAEASAVVSKVLQNSRVDSTSYARRVLCLLTQRKKLENPHFIDPLYLDRGLVTNAHTNLKKLSQNPDKQYFDRAKNRLVTAGEYLYREKVTKTGLDVSDIRALNAICQFIMYNGWLLHSKKKLTKDYRDVLDFVLLFMMAWQTGARVNELLTLDLKLVNHLMQLNVTDRLLKGKNRSFYISDETIALLKLYFQLYPDIATRSHLFEKPDLKDKLSGSDAYNHYYYRFKNIFLTLLLPEKVKYGVGFHDIRRAFAFTRTSDIGLYKVARILGHSKFQTLRYKSEYRKRTHDETRVPKFNPFEAKKKKLEGLLKIQIEAGTKKAPENK